MRLFGYDVDDDSAPLYDKNKKGVPPFDASGWRPGDSWSKLEQDKQAGKFDVRKYKTIAGQSYYIPNTNELASIIPTWLPEPISHSYQNVEPKKELHLVSFDDAWKNQGFSGVLKLGKIAGNEEGLYDVKIGNDILLHTNYDDEYTFKELPQGSNDYITYAIRFKGTKYESAWRYQYKKNDLANGGNRLIIRSIMLGKNSGKTLTPGSSCIATEEFFNANSAVERIFPAYGFIWPKYNTGGSTPNSTKIKFSAFFYRWSNVVRDFKYSYYMGFKKEAAGTGYSSRTFGHCLRPFKKVQ